MKRDTDKFLVRLDDGLRDKIKVAAAQSRRSMNAEINMRLEDSFEAEHAAQK